MIEIKAPNDPILTLIARHRVFLAGSIEQGRAEDWQQRVVDSLSHVDDVIVYNPLRKHWDATLEQSIDNPTFNEQVTWELDRLAKADIVPMYFQPGTLSPITLLELGLYATSDKLIVCCPPGFWRKGNVDIVCREYDIEQVETIDELVEVVRRRLRTRG